jgi:hypothetical protein
MASLGFLRFSGSADLGRLVQDRLEKVQQKFPDDIRMVVDKLTTITEMCQTVMRRLEEQDSTPDAGTAIKQMKQALDWMDCIVPSNQLRNSAN